MTKIILISKKSLNTQQRKLLNKVFKNWKIILHITQPLRIADIIDITKTFPDAIFLTEELPLMKLYELKKYSDNVFIFREVTQKKKILIFKKDQKDWQLEKVLDIGPIYEPPYLKMITKKVEEVNQ